MHCEHAIEIVVAHPPDSHALRHTAMMARSAALAGVTRLPFGDTSSVDVPQQHRPAQFGTYAIDHPLENARRQTGPVQIRERRRDDLDPLETLARQVHASDLPA